MKLKIAGIIAAIVALLGGGYTLGGGPGQTARTCAVTETIVTIGHQQSRTVLSSYGLRSWAKIQQPLQATNTVYLSFDEGAAATVNSPEFLVSASTSTTKDYVVTGLNYDFPYTGDVTALASTGSTTVRVIDCRY